MLMASPAALLGPDKAFAQAPQSKFRIGRRQAGLSGNVEGVLVKDRGHWLMEEAPDEVIPTLVEFLNR
jgi:pimeloyl-ACP methyl ester carboxylesterase